MTWDRSRGRPEPVRALDRVRHRENGEPLVPLAEYAPAVSLLRPSVIPYLRQTVAQMLQQAALSLPDDYRIGVTDAWRPLARQRYIYEAMTAWMLEVKPELTGGQLKRAINRWVAPPDRKAPPGHTTGAAVDVNLTDASGEVLDCVSPFDRLRGAPTFSYGLEPEAQRNRMILYDAMMGAGFSNCRDEWWHYSYGDAGWAVRMDRPECIYDATDLPPELYARQEEEWLEAFKARENPFRSSSDPATAKADSGRRG